MKNGLIYNISEAVNQEIHSMVHFFGVKIYSKYILLSLYLF